MEERFCPYCMSAVEEGVPCSSCGLTAGAYNPLPHHLPPGTILMDRYLVGRVLGEGGFGITYIGCDLRLELKVAIKEYFPTDKVTRHAMASLTVSSYIGAAASGYEAGKDRFLNEARTMARMDKQPQIVSVRDFFEANNTAYIVMEYVEGTTFKELVAQKGGRIPPAELFPMMEPLFSALSAMHERGLIHRDISPDNLMLENGALRLLDFGCARESSRGTETMTIALKHGYAPIEQYQHKGQGPWTDVYGLSATIYYCLTGKTPPQALDRLCEDELMLPRKLGVDITERQERALLYGMGIRPRRRFQSVEELHTALYEERVPIPQPPEAVPEQGLLREPVDEFAGLTDVKPAVAVVAEPLFETTAAPASESIFEPEAQPAGAEGAVAVAGIEREQGANESVLTRLAKGKKKLAIGGIAAAAVIVAVILLAVLPHGGGGPTVENSQPPAGDLLDQSAAPTQEPASDLFAQPAYLTGEVSQLGQELRDLMEDDSVSSIVVPANMGAFQVPGDEITITKPVLVQQGTELDAGSMVVNITGGGYLLIEGTLAVNQVFAFSDGGRLELTSTGTLAGEGLLWFDSEEDYSCHEQAAVGMDETHFLFADLDELFRDAVRVTNADELFKAQRQKAPAVIIASDAVVDLRIEFSQSMPVLIEEGAVVTSYQYAAWAVYENLLVNRGTLTGWVWACCGESGNARIINQGTLSPQDGFFLTEGSALYNDVSGEMNLRDIAQFNEGTLTVNLGTLSGHVELMGGRMLNLGTMVNTGGDSLGFNIAPGSEFTNRNQGTVEVYGGLDNQGRVFNGGGTITIHDGASFENRTLLETEGTLYLAENARINNSGIIRWYAGNGYIDYPERVGGYLIYDNGRDDWNNGMDVVEISTADELLAWARRGDSAATLTQSIMVEGELNVTTSLEIPEGVTLAVEVLTISGPTVRVAGVLEAHEVHVLDGALVYADGNISVLDGGLLNLDGGGNLIFQGSELDLTGSTLRIANGGQLYIASLEQTAIANVEVEEGGRLLSLNAVVLEGARVVVRNGQMIFPNGIENHKVAFTMEQDGFLYTNGLYLEAGQWTVDGGEFHTHGDVWLGGEVTLVNHGYVNFGGYEDKHTVQVEGVIENHGTLTAGGLPVEVHGQLDNQGTLYYSWGGSVTGNVTGTPVEKHPDSD